MDAEIIAPFINATINVLSTMAGMVPSPHEPRLKNETKSYGDVSGIIGLAGDGVRGAFAVSFSESCIVRVLSNMLGEKIQGLNEETEDAVGEITNMISGGAKAELSQKGFSFEMAIPSVVSGKGHSIENVTEHPVVVVPFDTEAGPFFVEVCLSKAKPE